MDLDPDPITSEIGWNYFSTSRDNLGIASAFDLRAYAKKAKRPFEACLAMLVVSLVVQQVFPTVKNHDPSIGCVFDYCGDRNDITRSLRTVTICEESLSQITPKFRPSVVGMFDAIREYSQ